MPSDAGWTVARDAGLSGIEAEMAAVEYDYQQYLEYERWVKEERAKHFRRELIERVESLTLLDPPPTEDEWESDGK